MVAKIIQVEHKLSKKELHNKYDLVSLDNFYNEGTNTWQDTINDYKIDWFVYWYAVCESDNYALGHALFKKEDYIYFINLWHTIDNSPMDELVKINYDNFQNYRINKPTYSMFENLNHLENQRAKQLSSLYNICKTNLEKEKNKEENIKCLFDYVEENLI